MPTISPSRCHQGIATMYRVHLAPFPFPQCQVFSKHVMTTCHFIFSWNCCLDCVHRSGGNWAQRGQERYAATPFPDLFGLSCMVDFVRNYIYISIHVDVVFFGWFRVALQRGNMFGPTFEVFFEKMKYCLQGFPATGHFSWSWRFCRSNSTWTNSIASHGIGAILCGCLWKQVGVYVGIIFDVLLMICRGL